MLIAIYGNRRQSAHATALRSLLRSLTFSDVSIAMHPKLYSHLTGDLDMPLPAVTVAPEDRIPDGTTLVISIGGDGTFLRTAAWTGDSEVPILGINAGTLGYLSALSVDEAVAHIDDIIAGHYTVEDRTLIHVSGAGVHGWPYALNEVVFSKDDYASIVSVAAEIDGRPLADYRADGLIVSTPTGSTAYNLSVGGPIVQPTTPVWIVSPIAAHSLGMRPLIISDRTAMTCRVTGRSRQFRLSVDGRSTLLPMGTQVTLTRAPFVTRIVMRHGNEFPAVLRNKLLFN